jgi:hypothetical protein
MTEKYLDERVKEIAEMSSPSTFLQRLFAKEVPAAKIKQILSEVYGRGFADGTGAVTRGIRIP